MNDYNTKVCGEVEISDVFRVLTRKKWWVVGIFLTILLSGLLFVFLRAPMYSIANRIYVKSSPITTPALLIGYQKILEYFPEDYVNLFQVPLSALVKDLESDEFAKAVKDKTSFDLKKAGLEKRYFLYIDQDNVNLTLIGNNPEKLLKVDKEIVNLFLTRVNSQLLTNYDEIIKKTSLKLAELKNNGDLAYEKIKNNSDISATSDFLLNSESYYKLAESKKILEDNKNFFTQRVQLLDENDSFKIYSFFNKKRDIVFVIFLAIALSILGTYFVNFLQNRGKKSN